MKKLFQIAQSIRHYWTEYYSNAQRAMRRAVEEDARRLGGRVVWEDTQ